jgi:hypothetical protein
LHKSSGENTKIKGGVPNVKKQNPRPVLYLETCARNHKDEKKNFKSNWDSHDQSGAAKKTWQTPWYEVREKPPPSPQQRRGLCADSTERLPLHDLTILRFA